MTARRRPWKPSACRLKTRMLAARSIHAVNVLTREMVESPHASTRVPTALGILVESRAWSEARISDMLS